MFSNNDNPDIDRPGPCAISPAQPRDSKLVGGDHRERGGSTVRDRRGASLVLLLGALASGLLFSSAYASDDSEELAQIFSRFVHSQHERALARSDRSCVTCHLVGDKGEPGMTQEQLAAYLVPPKAVCHQCHAPGQGDLGAGIGMTEAPHRCITCHNEVRVPNTHDAGWLAMHGVEAEAGSATCRDCHERSTCAECHDRRENTAYNIHDPTWLSVHGIAARATPGDCDSCHAKSECTTCHASASGFGRGP